MKYKINEIFVSIQGEGLLVGEPMNFIRFTQCNINCTWCDTDFGEGEFMSPEEILGKLDKEFEWVSLTGGEPMLEENLCGLIMELKHENYRVFLESNGTLFNKEIFDLCDFISIDIKPPSSGHVGCHRMDVFSFCLKNPEKTQVKVVIQDKEDVEFFRRIYKKEYLHWILQPEYDSMREVDYGKILDMLKGKGNVRIIPQVHKIIGVR